MFPRSFFGRRAFTFPKGRLSLVCPEEDNRDSGQNRYFKGRHQKEIDFRFKGRGRILRLSFILEGFRDYSENSKVSFRGWCTHREGPSAVKDLVGNMFRMEKSYAESFRKSGKEVEKELTSLILSVIYLKGHLFHNISFFPDEHS